MPSDAVRDMAGDADPFLKPSDLADGESLTVTFQGEGRVKETTWENDLGQEESAEAAVFTVYLHDAPGGMVDMSGDDVEAGDYNLLTGSSRLARELVNLAESYGDGDLSLLKAVVTAVGDGMDRKYRVEPADD